jgi:hypothetical protein
MAKDLLNHARVVDDGKDSHRVLSWCATGISQLGVPGLL